MLKKSIFYVILSGLITSGAVLGWGKTTSEPAKIKEDVAEQTESKTVDPAVHRAVIDAFDGNNEMAEVLKSLANDDRVKKLLKTSEKKIRLITPDTPPLVTEQNVEAAAPKTADLLAIMKDHEGFGKAENYAVVDIASNQIIESSNEENTAGFPALLSATIENDDSLFHAEGQKINKLFWHCLDAERHHCLVADMPMNLGISPKSMCDAAISEFVVCSGKDVDIFGANCPETTIAEATVIRDALKLQNAEQGTFEINGNAADAPARKFNFQKSALQGCDIYSVREEGVKPEINKAALLEDSEPEPQFSMTAIGSAALAGVIMIFLGLLCVKRKDDDLADNDAPRKDRTGSDKSDDALRKECDQIKKERDTAQQEKKDLDKLVEKLKTELSEGEERNRQLNSQLELARSQYKQEQLQRMNLAEDNRRLEEKLGENIPSEPVAGDKQNKPDNSDAKKAEDNRITAPVETRQIKDDEKVSDKESEHNRVTVQTEKTTIEQLPAGASNSFFESLSDEGWNEIEDSFDSLFAFAPKKDVPLSSMVKDETTSETDLSGGFSGFFEAIQENRRRDANDATGHHVDTQTLIKPVDPAPEKSEGEGRSSKRQLPTLRSVSPLSSGPSGLKSATLNGFGLSKKLFEEIKSGDENKSNDEKPTVEEKKPDDENKSADEKPTVEEKKPATEKKTVEVLEKVDSKPKTEDKSGGKKEMDENSLLNALKRRVKDVSELDNSANEKNLTKTSGSFDYSRGLSKSGAFSVTGSRVDIDPFSDKQQFKLVYESYIAELKKIGEPTDKFTMEQFVSKLARQKAELIKKGGYKNVTFTVVIKDGKPGINAVTQK